MGWGNGKGIQLLELDGMFGFVAKGGVWFRIEW